MLIYLLQYLSIYLYSKIIPSRKVQTCLISVQMFLILALRSISVGYVDLVKYEAGYQFIGTLGFRDLLSRLHLIQTADLIYPFSFESGFTAVNWIFAAPGLPFQAFLIAYAAFCSYSVGRFIYRYSKNPCLSFAMFTALTMFTYSFYILRQTLATCILLFAVPAILERKPGRFFLLQFLAFTMHRASIVFLPIYFLYKIKISRKLYRRISVLWCTLLLVAPLIYSRVIIPILQILGKATYANMEYRMNTLTIMMFLLLIMVYLFTSFPQFFQFFDFCQDSNKLVCYCFLMAIPFQIIGMCNDAFARLVQIYFIFAIILIPNVIMAHKNQLLRFLGENALYAMLFLFYIMILRGSYIVPYLPFWSSAGIP